VLQETITQLTNANHRFATEINLLKEVDEALIEKCDTEVNEEVKHSLQNNAVSFNHMQVCVHNTYIYIVAKKNEA